MAEIPGKDVRNTISGGNLTGPVLMGRDFRVTLPTSAPVALAALPPLVTGFTGREDELSAMTSLLNPDTPEQPIVVSAVAGLAGVGKSSLAIEAAHAAYERGWFPGGVLFIDLHGYDDAPVEPAQALDTLLRALGVSAEHLPPTVEERSGLYRSVLTGIPDPVLVIADNASSETQVWPLLPGLGPHRIVVTSREVLAGLEARLVDITVLDDLDGIALVDTALRLTRPNDSRVADDHDNAARLVRLCNGLPLALQIAAALLKADLTLSTGELAGQLSDERKRLERLRYRDGSPGQGLSVEAAFELSYRRLKDGAARVFRMLPLSPGPDVATDTAVIITGQRFYDVRKFLGQLATAHMIEASPTGPGRWRMHDLVRLYAQRLSDTHADKDRRNLARDWLLSYYQKMSTAAIVYLLVSSSESLPKEFTSRNEALAWLDAERSSLVAAIQMADGLGKYQFAFDLAVVLVEYLAWRRYLNEWVAVATIGLHAARELSDPGSEAGALNNLGIALRETRQIDKAVAAHRNAAAMYRRIGDLHHEGAAMYNLGMALRDMRLFGEAIVAYQRDLTICRRLGDKIGEGTTLNGLAYCLRESNHPDDAIDASQKAVEIFRRFKYQHGEGLALSSLSASLSAIGQLDAAVTAGKGAVDILREVSDRYNEGMALMNVGVALNRANQYSEAVSISKEATAIFRETGDLHAQALAVSNLAGSLLKMQRLDEAITADQRCINLFRETGDRHGEGQALSNFGLALREAQRVDEAIDAYQTAAAIFRDIADWHDAGTALKDLAATLYEAKRLEESIDASQGAVTLLRQTGDRQGEGTALYTLGVALREVQRFDESIGALHAAVEIFHERGDSQEAAALGHLAVPLGETSQFDEAIVVGKKAATLFRETGDLLGEGTALYNLGLAMGLARRFEDAVATLQNAASIFQRAGDQSHLGKVMDELSNTQRELGQFDKAIASSQEAITIFRAIRDRQREGDALYNLGSALLVAQRIKEATAAMQDAAAIYEEGQNRAGVIRVQQALGVLESYQETDTHQEPTNDEPC